MSVAFRVLSALFARRIAGETKKYLRAVTREQIQASRTRSSELLRQLSIQPGPHVALGQTASGENVSIPLSLLITAWGFISGATGSGKSMLGALLIEGLLQEGDPQVSFGVLDAKGETFERTLFFIARLLDRLPPPAAARLRERLVIIDFSSSDPLAAYNLSAPWSGADLDFFSTSRTTMLEEIFPTTDGISLRGASILRHTIKLLAEQKVPFSYADHVLASEAFRSGLLARTEQEDLRQYFTNHFPSESRATLAALRARLAATLFSSGSLRLALSGSSAPDFGALMDTGAIILINSAGANIPRATARTLQAVVLSDIRHAVFNRAGRNTAWWIFDEAQHLFRTKYLREHMTDLLTMSRSFSTFGVLLTQHMANAVADAEIVECLHTNAKWSFVFRGSPKDAAFLQSALPVSGRRQKPKSNPYAPPEFYSPSEERSLVLQEISSLPDRHAWLWLKSLTREAISLATCTVEIPDSAQYTEAVGRIRNDSSLGRRQSRATFMSEISRLDAKWQTGTTKRVKRDLVADLADLYRAEEEGSR